MTSMRDVDDLAGKTRTICAWDLATSRSRCVLEQPFSAWNDTPKREENLYWARTSMPFRYLPWSDPRDQVCECLVDVELEGWVVAVSGGFPPALVSRSSLKQA